MCVGLGNASSYYIKGNLFFVCISGHFLFLSRPGLLLVRFCIFDSCTAMITLPKKKKQCVSFKILLTGTEQIILERLTFLEFLGFCLHRIQIFPAPPQIMHLTSGVENHPGLQRKFGSSCSSTGQKCLRTIEKVYADKTMGVYIYFELVLSFSLSKYPGV